MLTPVKAVAWSIENESTTIEASQGAEHVAELAMRPDSVAMEGGMQAGHTIDACVPNEAYC